MTSPTESKPHNPVVLLETKVQKWAPLIIMGLAVVIIVLDTTLLNVSLSAIVRDLHTSIQSLQWVIAAYSLTLAALTITGGRIGDLFGRKRMFIIGAIIFAIGSFLASESHNVGTLILGESVIEGVGAALMMPATASLLVANYRGRDRALALGVWGGMAALGAAIGPVLGGYLTSHYSWRWGFRINVFVAAALVLGSLLIKDNHERDENPDLDWLGVFLSAAGLFFGVFAIIEGSTYGWITKTQNLFIGGWNAGFGSWSVVPLSVVLCIGLLSSFVWWQQRRVTMHRTPLVSMKLFTVEQFRDGALLTMFMSLGQVGIIFGIPVFLQSVRNLNALHTGYALIPMSLMLLITSPLAGLLSKHFVPKRIVQFGLATSLVGLFLLRRALSIHTTLPDLFIPFGVYGIGLGLNISQLSNITLSAVSVNQSGEASGVNNTMRQIGGSLGTAVIGSILIASVGVGLRHGVEASSVIPVNQRTTIAKELGQQSTAVEFGIPVHVSTPLSVEQTAEIRRISNASTVSATRKSLIYTMIFMAFAFLFAVRLPYTKNLERNESLAVH